MCQISQRKSGNHCMEGEFITGSQLAEFPELQQQRSSQRKDTL